MRFVKLLRQYGLIAALSAALAACAGLSPAPKGASTAAASDASGAKTSAKTTPENAGGKPATAAAAGSSNTGGAAALPNADLAPQLSPDVLRAFDTSLRALQQGRLSDAERGFLALTRSNPELGGPHANLGIIYRRAGKIAQAISELEFAVRDSPGQPVYWNQLGITYRQQGQFAKAREAYERALALDPAYASANLNLGILFDLYLWDSKRALELYDRYLALSGGDEKVSKWVTDLKNRNRDRTAVARKEQE
ncbi:MAG TPA: tetratricopeptide repeat protein [Burkholderiaceae bacterium]|nr:tetratricopeptide repeat protein [Burkholderiaceae bacterium]